MAKGHKAAPARIETGEQHRSVPQGYRQGIITAITVLLGFSLAFFRFWGFEAPGRWTIYSVLSTGTLLAAVALQVFALFRSLRPEDDRESEYRKTVKWFIGSALVLVVALLIALLEVASGSGVGK
jgi:hypothetical protein